MKSFTVALKSLLLALLLSSNAYALDKVDINTASAEELDKVLTNVGRSKAEAIVEHRQANGPSKVPRNWHWSRASDSRRSNGIET